MRRLPDNWPASEPPDANDPTGLPVGHQNLQALRHEELQRHGTKPRMNMLSTTPSRRNRRGLPARNRRAARELSPGFQPVGLVNSASAISEAERRQEAASGG